MTRKQQQPKNSHTISMLVSNKPGVLVRIALTFARRGFNIDSLVVSPTFDPRFSRMTVTAQGDYAILKLIIGQVNKLVDVIHAWEHTGKDSVHAELALYKVRHHPASKAVIIKLLKHFRIKVLDDTDNIMIIEQVGTTEDLDELEASLKKHHLIEMVRTGKVVMSKGHEET